MDTDVKKPRKPKSPPRDQPLHKRIINFKQAPPSCRMFPEELKLAMAQAVADINQYADKLWLDNSGKPYPVRNDFETQESQCRELCNLITGRAPVITQKELDSKTLLDSKGEKPLAFNFKAETWATLLQCVEENKKHDLSIINEKYEWRQVKSKTNNRLRDSKGNVIKPNPDPLPGVN